MTTVPASPLFRFRSWLLPLLAILCAAGMWTYVNRVMISHQISEAAAHGRPRGNLSDLYPHWIGARELLLHGRDPYSPEVTREIQQGYYGRPLDPVRPGDPRDQQGFAYPVYVAFYLAPTIQLPFEVVRRGFFWVLLGLTLATIPLWLRVLHWSVPVWAQVSLMVLTVGSLTVVQGLKLQQMTLLVVALLAVAMALFASDWPIAAGMVVALTTIKPQLVWLFLLCLMIWTLADWRRRYRWAASFLLTMAILSGASAWYLPHWIFRFVEAMRRYLNYTDAVSILDLTVPAPWGWMSRVFVVAATLHIAWKNRRFAEDTPAFAATVSLALAVTVIVIPSYALYNQAMLLPALLMLLRDRQTIWNRNRVSRVLLSLAVILLLWPWLASLALACLSFVLPLELVERAWMVPGWTVLQIPLVVAALMLIHYYQGTNTAPAGPVTS
ncbi:MAG TPA: glycosyltransferase family 87 protein [Bryobacteraceae bacterium]|nr:glycosyltransferase family 87 protein [Bryobacteraceae bacterium]